MNCVVCPTWGILAALGYTLMAWRTEVPVLVPPHVLVKVVCPTMLPSVAVIVVVPQPTAVARPVAPIVATLVVLDDHVTEDEMFSGGTLV